MKKNLKLLRGKSWGKYLCLCIYFYIFKNLRIKYRQRNLIKALKKPELDINCIKDILTSHRQYEFDVL